MTHYEGRMTFLRLVIVETMRVGLSNVIYLSSASIKMLKFGKEESIVTRRLNYNDSYYSWSSALGLKLFDPRVGVNPND